MLGQLETIPEGSHLTLVRPLEQRPVLVEVPHSGLTVPSELVPSIDAPRDGVLRDSDLYVDELYADAPQKGASMLVAHASRYVVDLNRAADDVDLDTVPDHPAPRGIQPRGVVWRMTTDGRALMRRPLTYAELEQRLSRFHRPYHAALRSELTRLRARFGYAVLLAAHSMPSTGRILTTGRLVRRADVVPGTRGGSTADRRVIDLVDAHFRDAGLSVRHDDPYRGGYTTAHYGRPRDGWHAIQIELNRGLYVDEATSQRREPEFSELRRVLSELVAKLSSLEL
ncbi:MAG: N-formylglutamate amidohydrolase [Sandaracinus sp.]|nr:N-formylglutamate amidohydrolase [Myxococcales bacterium]MCB9604929.1 N-formylglutamate amidohydrolase [Sandaracinus sp.]